MHHDRDRRKRTRLGASSPFPATTTACTGTVGSPTAMRNKSSWASSSPSRHTPKASLARPNRRLLKVNFAASGKVVLLYRSRKAEAHVERLEMSTEANFEWQSDTSPMSDEGCGCSPTSLQRLLSQPLTKRQSTTTATSPLPLPPPRQNFSYDCIATQ